MTIIFFLTKTHFFLHADTYIQSMKTVPTHELKPVEQLSFADDFMFGAVMRDPVICKGVIERLLQI